MVQIRYAKSLRDLERTSSEKEDSIDADLRQLRIVYETDSEAAQVVVPRPLEATAEPRIHVSMGHVRHGQLDEAATDMSYAMVGVAVQYDGREAIYPVMSAMTSDAAVTRSRERFGLPSKWARVRFDANTRVVSGGVERRGVEFLRTRAEVIEEIRGRDEIEEIYAFKALAGCLPSKGFDQDPQLVRLEVQHRFHSVRRLDGTLELAESPFDPVVDLPVRRLAEFEFSEGTCRVRGRVLRPVPGDWLLPFLHQRHDDPGIEGADV